MEEKMSSARKVVLADSKGSVVVSRKVGDVGIQNPITYAPYGSGENKSSWGYNGEFRSQSSELYLLGKGNRAYLLNYGIMNRSDRTSPEQAGINPYRYCTGNPVNFSDPTGNTGGVKWRAGLGIFFGIVAIGLAIPTAGTSVGLFAGDVSLTSGILGVTGIALGATAVGLSSSSIHLENNSHTDEAHEQALRRSNFGLVLGIAGATLSTASLGKIVGGETIRMGTRADQLSESGVSSESIDLATLHSDVITESTELPSIAEELEDSISWTVISETDTSSLESMLSFTSNFREEREMLEQRITNLRERMYQADLYYNQMMNLIDEEIRGHNLLSAQKQSDRHRRTRDRKILLNNMSTTPQWGSGYCKPFKPFHFSHFPPPGYGVLV